VKHIGIRCCGGGRLILQDESTKVKRIYKCNKCNWKIVKYRKKKNENARN